MPAIGFGMLWSGYTLLFYGWCRIKGYDVGMLDVVVPGRFKGKWPPPLIDDTGDSADPKVKPGDHPGDMPWTYKDPNERSAGDHNSGKGSGKGGGSSSTGGGSMWV